ncbi:putative peptidase S59, nucleoporin, nucleoporin peptidase S59 [Helianthus annuus]|nr:putative peptidase S59, nucleoporin, nucleoporin peptidase S59 [Helianthus annuus]
MENPSPAASPFGTLPPKPHMFVDGSQCKQPIQYGISSLRVKDKPAPVKYSMLTTRHLSGRIKLPVRKYDPKSNAPKVPYFSDTEEIPIAAYVPRENPRALVVSPEKWQQTANMENIHEEKIYGSTYENERDDITEEKQLYTTILDVPAKLQQPDYYTHPQISELEAKERADPGFCRHVKEFVVGRYGYGSIKFLGETDVRKVDIETVVQFNNREVIVYMDDSKKPPVGEGLNKAAEITLLNIKCFDKKTGMQHMDGSKISKYTEMLKKKATAQGAEFMSYDPVEGEWKFRVQHF